MKVVCLGDSLTFGYGVYPGENWCDLVKKNLNIDIINKGINGDTSSGMLFRSFSDVINLNPSSAMVMGGTNDFLMGYDVDRVVDNISTILIEIKEKGIVPYLGIQIPVYNTLAKKFWDEDIDYSKVNDDISLYRNKMIKFVEKYSINFFDFHKLFNDNLSNFQCLFIDGVHPTKKGHEIMARIIKF